MLDIETSPNLVWTWGLWNQNIALSQIERAGETLCWAAKWLGAPPIYFSSVHGAGKEAMLLGIYEKLDDADVVVHYNGARFDIPILFQEFASLGWGPPSPFLQIDLYKVVKKQFRLLSNKLDYVAGYFGLGGKLEHKGMSLWKDCMAGDEDAWKFMERYNKQDVVLLDPLYKKLLPWIPNHPNYGLFEAGNKKRCPNCGSDRLQKRGKAYTSTLTYQRYRCNECGSWSKDRLTMLDKDQRQHIVKGM